jgi:hypothetical protein
MEAGFALVSAAMFIGGIVAFVLFVELCANVRRIMRATEAAARAVPPYPPQAYPQPGPTQSYPQPGAPYWG